MSQLKIVVSPLPRDPGLFSVHTPCVPKLIFCHWLRNTHSELATECIKVWIWYSGHCRCSCASWWGSSSEIFPVVHGWAACWSPQCSQQELYPFNALLSTYFLISLLQSWGSQFNTLGAVCEKLCFVVVVAIVVFYLFVC